MSDSCKFVPKMNLLWTWTWVFGLVMDKQVSNDLIIHSLGIYCPSDLLRCVIALLAFNYHWQDLVELSCHNNSNEVNELIKRLAISIRKHSPLRACSHVVYQMQTQRGVESGSINLEGSSLIICPTHSLYMSFINCGSHNQNQYLIIHGLYIEIIEDSIWSHNVRYW